MKNIKLQKNRAFTLIELLLAIFVLEIGLLGIAGFYTYSLRITQVARFETTASNLAAGLLDETLVQSFDSIQGVSRSAYSSDSTSPFKNYDKQIDVAYVNKNLQPESSDQNLKKVTVTIFWQQDNHEKSYQIASLKAKE